MAEAKKPTKTTTPSKTTKRATPNTAPAAPAYASKYTVGDLISHPMFGNGNVTAIHTNKLTIEFPDSVTKQIVDDFVAHRKQ
jgi:hypothetical protein